MERNRLKFESRNEWLEARKEGIGASEVATIVGLNPWETPYQLWRKKLGMDKPEPENDAMKRGHYCEDAVARWWADDTQREVIKASVEDFMFIDPKRPYLRVSPDRTFWLPDVARNDDNKGILECKTTNAVVDKDNIPKHWFCQVQMNLGVAGYEQGALAWMQHGFEFGRVDIQFVPDFFQWLADEVSRFWVDHVLGKKEPDATSVKDVLLKYNRHIDGKSVEVNSEVLDAYHSLKEVKRELAELDERKAAYEEKIKLAFGDAEAVTYEGETLATWKAPKPSQKFNEKSFKGDHPDLWAQYCEEVQGSRRFLLK